MLSVGGTVGAHQTSRRAIIVDSGLRFRGVCFEFANSCVDEFGGGIGLGCFRFDLAFQIGLNQQVGGGRCENGVWIDGGNIDDPCLTGPSDKCAATNSLTQRQNFIFGKGVAIRRCKTIRVQAAGALSDQRRADKADLGVHFVCAGDRGAFARTRRADRRGGRFDQQRCARAVSRDLDKQIGRSQADNGQNSGKEQQQIAPKNLPEQTWVGQQRHRGGRHFRLFDILNNLGVHVVHLVSPEAP